MTGISWTILQTGFLSLTEEETSHSMRVVIRIIWKRKRDGSETALILIPEKDQKEAEKSLIPEKRILQRPGNKTVPQSLNFLIRNRGNTILLMRILRSWKQRLKSWIRILWPMPQIPESSMS